MHRYMITDPTTQRTIIKRLTAKRAESMRKAGFIVEW